MSKPRASRPNAVGAGLDRKDQGDGRERADQSERAHDA